jgi:hypothetical protein
MDKDIELAIKDMKLHYRDILGAGVFMAMLGVGFYFIGYFIFNSIGGLIVTVLLGSLFFIPSLFMMKWIFKTSLKKLIITLNEKPENIVWIYLSSDRHCSKWKGSATTSFYVNLIDGKMYLFHIPRENEKDWISKFRKMNSKISVGYSDSKKIQFKKDPSLLLLSEDN